MSAQQMLPESSGIFNFKAGETSPQNPLGGLPERTPLAGSLDTGLIYSYITGARDVWHLLHRNVLEHE